MNFFIRPDMLVDILLGSDNINANNVRTNREKGKQIIGKCVLSILGEIDGDKP